MTRRRSILIPRFMQRWLIPRGDYCYGYTRKSPRSIRACPFWESRPDLIFPSNALVAPHAVPAYCHYLKVSDLDDMTHPLAVYARGRGEISPPEVCEDVLDCGMLWDQLKECGVRSDW